MWISPELNRNLARLANDIDMLNTFVLAKEESCLPPRCFLTLVCPVTTIEGPMG